MWRGKHLSQVSEGVQGSWRAALIYGRLSTLQVQHPQGFFLGEVIS